MNSSSTAAATEASPKLIETLKSSVTNGESKEQLAKTINTTDSENVVSNGDIHVDKSSSVSATASSEKDEPSENDKAANVDLNGSSKENGNETTSNKDEDEAVGPPVVTSSEAAKSSMDIEEMDDNAVDLELPKEPKDEVENDPNFAVICSFLAQFGTALEIRYSIWQLKMMFEDYSKGN